MMSLWDALRMNMMISYQELVRTFLSLTLTMAPAFKDEGELTDMTDITGNLTVLVEAK
ncbi:hypothetical protein KVP95_14650 [Escherichia coli]|uniref:hypothetical protein n=1 Tax=Escherichia coli TaxID=562 RepID=UPI001F0678D0|nr:hypothetical protein [Escherichia coli]MCH0682012.1 hypothetical protein [Escherichia coli]